jgi:AcrR family transcriptional regulator
MSTQPVREDLSMSDAEEESGWTKRRSKLLERYEQIAWNLFAKRGFREVTVDEIAEAAGVSARTLFRYFPTKEDFLLGFPRRGAKELTAAISRMPASPTPIQSVWQLIREHSLTNPSDVRLLTLWRRAADDAPEIHARVRGERVHELTEAVTRYCAASLNVAESDDPRPRLFAGVLVGVEISVIELWGRSEMSLTEIFAAAETALPDLLGAGPGQPSGRARPRVSQNRPFPLAAGSRRT